MSPGPSALLLNFAAQHATTQDFGTTAAGLRFATAVAEALTWGA
jgi:hypothetical protein